MARSSYVLTSASGALGAFAVGGLDPSLIAYPAYFACANGFTAVVISVGRRRRPPERPQGRIAEWDGKAVLATKKDMALTSV